MIKRLSITLLVLCAFFIESKAQQDYEPLPDNMQRCEVRNGDTLILVRLRDVLVYSPLKWPNKKQQEAYWRLVRDVKKTLPMAKLVYATLTETYEYMETLPDQKAKDKHLRRMEKELMKKYYPVLKTYTYSQGKLLLRLIDRECNQNSYTLIKSFLGSFTAGFWQTFGSVFGVSLKVEWDPQGKDKLTERVVQMVEAGVL
ncbi:MAG: DUF4294 domain-containing protein [Bacteroidales bacterium]|nr:DUF4294 domain-containing protein [Bacteroidales bacterium]